MITRNTPLTLTMHSVVRFKNFCPNSEPLRNFAPPAARAVPKALARPPLPAFQRARLRAKVAAVTCSEPWTELAATAAEDHGIAPNIVNISAPLADRGIYPPRPELGPEHLPRIGAVRMRRCDGCGRIVPPNNVACHRMVRLCDDCRIEPDVDPDLSADRDAHQPDGARAPRAQFGLLMERLVDKDANRQTAREQLNEIGLTDAEITAMALTLAGYSTRRVADLSQCSQTYVRKLLNSAAKKLRRSGLQVPRPPTDGTSHRPCSVDPVKLDAMTAHVSERVG